MPNIVSFDILDKEIQKVPGRPTVLEALWDGDTPTGAGLRPDAKGY